MPDFCQWKLTSPAVGWGMHLKIGLRVVQGSVWWLAIGLMLWAQTSVGQAKPDTTAIQDHGGASQDDPSNVLTRVEIFNEYQQTTSDRPVNITTFRGIMALGKRFTTRIDIPYVALPTASSPEATAGLSDISVRLLGYRLLKTRRSAMLASVELSMPTAQSPLLGSGRYVLTPVVAYSTLFPKTKSIVALTYQEFFSFGGDESRQNIRWTRFQLYHIQPWSGRFWTMLLPEYYYDHADGGSSMNVELFGFYRISNAFSCWLKGGAGLFGEHLARYTWTSEVGLRYLILRKRPGKSKP
jgi:hypothetical protein